MKIGEYGMNIRIKYIDGIRFKRFIMTSAQRINQTEDHLNYINVFPVADGDTGTNLAITMNNIVIGIKDFQKNSFGEMIEHIARSALKGARGNSGAILAQFFQGLAESTRGMKRLTTVAFSNAAVKAAEQATMAIAKPREGTIITVMKDWAHYVNNLANKTPDFVELFKQSLKKAKTSLLETPNKLNVLKKAGVVDAGAEGFVNLLEGIVEFIEFGKLKTLGKIENELILSQKGKLSHFYQEKAMFRYCTECLIEGNNLERNTIKQKLNDLGDSQVVAGSDEQIRIHIHTNQPDLVISQMSSLGKIIETKVDDMWNQTQGLYQESLKRKISLITDSTCDLPEELIKKYRIRIVPIAVHVNKESYLDRVDISTGQIVEFLEKSNNNVTTSQPPYQFFEDVYQKAGKESDGIISIHISGRLSGTYQAACVASRKNKYNNRIEVIDARTSTVALGLVVLKTARMIEQGISMEEIIKNIKYSISHSRIFVSIPTLKYLMKSGRLDRFKGIIGTMMRLKPVITLDREGAFEEAAKVVGYKNLLKKTIELSTNFARTLKNPSFGIAHIQDIQLAKWYKEELSSRFPQSEIIIAEGSPALSVHIGRGGTAIAAMEN